jgi:uncharacterized membrane protein YbhN (UPF0104 family)
MACELASLTARALRWRVLLSGLAPVSLGQSFNYMMIGYLANAVLPARAGEVIRAALLGARREVSKSAVFATVVVERLFDVLSLLVFVGILVAALPLPPAVAGSILVGEASALAAAAVLVWAARSGRDPARFLPGFLPFALRARAAGMLRGFVQGLASLQSGRQLWQAAGWSLVSWGIFAASIWLLLQAAGLGALPWYATPFLIVVTNLGSAIPSSPGFVGGYHFLVVYALALWAVPAGQALAFAVVSHGLNYLGVLVLGAYALWHENLALRQLREASSQPAPGAGAETAEPLPGTGTDPA